MPSYSSYVKHMAVFDAKDDDIQEWITVRGNHIPIKKGQSKEEAVKNFIANKSDKESSSRANKPEHIGKAANKVVKQTGENRKIYKEATSKKLSEEEKKHQEIEAGWQKTLKSLEPQTAEQASLWIAETLASTEGFTSANFSKEDKEMLKKLESKFGSELAKMEEENALYEKARENVMGSIDPDPSTGSYYPTDFMSPSEYAEYQKGIEEDIEKEFQRLKGEKEKSEKFDYGEGWPKSPKFEKLTEQYMPATGESDNELGEMLRSINRATYRYYNDGDVWNKGYGKETVNAAIKHLTELAKNKNIPRHISRGLENGLYELKKAGNNKDKYETGLKLLLQTVEFAPEADINAMLKMKRNSGN